jgi:predicted nuclease with RNAse H fold
MPCVVGIDWATEPKNRALVVLDVEEDFSGCRVERVDERVEDAVAVAACTNPDHAVVAIDIPFGWPREFARFASRWNATTGKPAPPASDEFRFRLTDRIVRDEAGKVPLPVSADRIAMGARAWADVVANHALGERIDAVGELHAKTPTVIEIYPGASALAFGRPTSEKPEEDVSSYKKSDVVRRRLITHVASLFHVDLGGNLEQIVSKSEDSDETDAFLAAVTAAIHLADCKGATLASAGWRVRPPRTPNETELALCEGWIFFPLRP